MREKWAQTLEEIRRRLGELVESLDEALRPPPELVPIPVEVDPVDGSRRGGRRSRG